MVKLVTETRRCKTIALEVPDWAGHRAGQHVDVRLTAEDGYQAQRSYSIASAPGDAQLSLTVERIADGEVSPYLVDELRPGDQIELRGPIGGHFVWEESLGGPLVLIGGGSGIVPLRAMLRHWAAGSRTVDAHLLYSSRSLSDVIYRSELERLASDDPAPDGRRRPLVALVLTRDWPDGWSGHRGRIDSGSLAELVPAPSSGSLTYVCGPNAFVEAIAQALVRLGHEPLGIRTERFGPTGPQAGGTV